MGNQLCKKSSKIQVNKFNILQYHHSHNKLFGLVLQGIKMEKVFKEVFLAKYIYKKILIFDSIRHLTTVTEKTKNMAQIETKEKAPQVNRNIFLIMCFVTKADKCHCRKLHLWPLFHSL